MRLNCTECQGQRIQKKILTISFLCDIFLYKVYNTLCIKIGELKTQRLERTLRTYVQKHKNIAYVFMGSKKHLIVDMFNNSNRPFYKAGRVYPLEKIDKQELCRFIEKKFNTTERILSRELSKQIVEICESHPYYMQYLCHIIWENQKKGKISTTMITQSLDNLIKRNQAVFEATWDPLTNNQRLSLMAIANLVEEDKLFSAEFIFKNRLGTPTILQRTLKSLVDKSLVDKEGSKYSIIDVFFKKWLLSL